MTDRITPKPARIPFFLADLLLLGAALFVYVQSPQPLPSASLGLIILATVAAACLGVLPFVLEYRTWTRVSEANSLEGVVSQIRRLESVGEQVQFATSQWQAVQDSAATTANQAKSIADQMAAEVDHFTSFMEKAQESEKATLRLEVQKLRRAEADWLQVLIHMLDHTFALHKAALRSGQKTVVDQVSAFQNACRDTARRVGLAPFVPTPGEAFHPERHQVLEGDGTPPAGALVTDTVAVGFTYQGRLVRPALVKLEGSAQGNPPTEALSSQERNELSLGGAPSNPA